MHYYLTLLSRASLLHLLRWSRYRADVLLWILTIWITIAIQVCFVYVTFEVVGGSFFGYSKQELASFFGIALFATGLAQSLLHGGIVMRLANAVWNGNFDFWLLQPAPLPWRILLEDMGFVWFWPHLCAGIILLLMYLPPSMWLLGFATAFTAAAIEAGLLLCLCLPAIRWGKWDPNEGIWEYMDSVRLAPIGRSRNIMLWLASFGVLQYSLALEVITGNLPFLLLCLVAAGIWALAFLLLRLLIRSYSSASS